MAIKQKRHPERLTQTSQIFEGVVVYIDGITGPPQHELKDLITRHGGAYEEYPTNKVTHTVATILSLDRTKKFGTNGVIVKVSWITDSVMASRVLPIDDYLLYAAKNTGQDALLITGAGKGFDRESEGEDTHDDEEGDMMGNLQPDKLVDINDPNFLDHYYQSSRLHHLSTWREELKIFANSLMGKRQRVVHSSDSKRVIFHVDMDCFFTSVSLRDHPELTDSPVAITHAANKKDGSTLLRESSSSDVSSCNYIARSFGVKNGMYLSKALSLCPQLVLLPYDFEQYKKVAYELYKILADFSNELNAVSCDEAYIDVTELVTDKDPIDHARIIRESIFEKCQCTASIGIGSNMLIARLATKKAKPNNQWQVREEEQEEFMKQQPLSDIPGVGWSMTERLSSLGWDRCGDLWNVSQSKLQGLFGPKAGLTLYNRIRGVDERTLGDMKQRKSVGSDVNWGVRFTEKNQAIDFIKRLSIEVFKKQASLGLVGNKIQLKVLKRKPGAGEPLKRLGCGSCDSYNKSRVIKSGVHSLNVLQDECISLYLSFQFPPTEVRGIGIFISDLREVATERQTSILKLFDKPKKNPDADGDHIDCTLRRLGYDRNIFNELPDEIKNEIISEAQPNKLPSKRTKVDFFNCRKRIEPKVEFPPDIDLSVLDSLPKEIRSELVEQFKSKPKPAPE